MDAEPRLSKRLREPNGDLLGATGLERADDEDDVGVYRGGRAQTVPPESIRAIRCRDPQVRALGSSVIRATGVARRRGSVRGRRRSLGWWPISNP